MSRRPLTAAVLAVAAALVVPAQAVSRHAPEARALRWLRVPVEGGGSISLPYRGAPPRGVTASRQQRPAGPVPADAADPTTNRGPRAGHEAAQFPVDAGTAPGTIATIAGGQCEGYPAREATIAPAHLAYDKQGRLYWADVVMQSGSGQRWGSTLIRMLDTDGRVRTIGPVQAPVEGRWMRQSAPDTSLVSLVPDNAGGVYLNVTVVAEFDPASTDEPAGNAIVHLRADGTRQLVVGGLPTPHGPFAPGSNEGDPVTATALRQVQGWTFDEHGNVYLADAIGSGFMGTRIRFANRSATAVTFYQGTPSEVTVEPGRIRTIAGTGIDTIENGAGYVRQPEQPARTSNYYEIPRLALHRVGGTDVLYFINTRWGGWEAPAGSAPALIHAVNLFSPTPVVVNGQPVRLGDSRVVAGNVAQPAGYSGDGGPAVAAQFGFLTEQSVGDFYVANDGSLVVADTANHRVRVVDPLGLVRTVAGTGVAGFNAEGASAVLSTLWLPDGIVADRQGRTVVADFANARIRRIENDGRLVTIAGRGPTPCGDGHLATGTTVHEGASFGDLSDVAYDSKGNLWVADAAYKTIRRIAPNGRLDLVVGRPQRCAGYLTSATDSVPAPRVADPCPFVGAQASDSPLPDLLLGGPQHFAVDSYDNLVVSDVDRLVYVNLRKTPVSVLGITVPALAARTLKTFGARSVHVEVRAPGGLVPSLPPGLPPLPVDPATPIAFDFTVPLGDVALDRDGTAYVSDSLLDVVYRVSTCNDVRVLAGTGHGPLYAGQGDGGPAAQASLVPRGLDIDRAHRLLYVVDTNWSGSGGPNAAYYGSRVRAVNLDPKAAHDAYGLTIAPGAIETVAGGGGCSDVGAGCAYGYGGPVADAALGPYAQIALARDGSMYVADGYTHRIGVVFPDGRYYGIAGPWPEKRDGQQWLSGYGDTTYAAGYLGDGGRALDAWFSWNFSADSPDGALTLDPHGGLVVTDAVGRARRIRDVAHTQLRTGSVVPPLPRAGVGFSEVAVGVGPALAGSARSAVTRPDLAETTTGPLLSGAAGAGRGCATWQVRRNADGHGHDVATADGTGKTAAFPLGGSDCALADGTLVTSVRARDGAAADDAGLVAATGSANGWTPVPVVSTDRAGGLGLGAPAVSADGSVIAFPTATGALAVATRSGAAYTSTATPVTGIRAVGDVVVRNGTTYVGFVSSTPKATVVQVAAVTSSGGSSETVAAVDGPTRATVGAPSLAVDATGTMYAAWSDKSYVFVSRRDRAGWSEPTKVRALFASTLPTITAGRAGQVAVAFFASARPRSDAADPYAFWYAATAVSHDGGRTFATALASGGDVLRGALCDGCPPADDTGGLQSAVATCALGGPCPATDIALGRATAPGRVRVRLAPDGGLGLAFAVDAALTPDGMAPGVGYLRSCSGSGLAPARGIPACTGPRAPVPVRRPPAPGPGNGIPAVPAVPSPGGCSPAPPAYGTPSAPAPHRHPVPEERPEPRTLVPPLALVFLPPPPPPDVVPPEAQAPAANAQANQAQQTESNTASQVNPAAGIAPDEEEQHQTANELALSLLPLTAAAFAAGCGAFELRRRRQASPVLASE